MISALCLVLSAMLSFTPTPPDTLRTRLILTEVAEHGEMSRSESDLWHGQCKRFQHDSFAAVAPAFMLEGYPGAALFLPLEHAAAEETGGRTVGTAWTMPDASQGNAFVEVARFDFDRQLTQRENEAQARAFLQNARAGDMMQMMARYSSGGRGTHTIMFTQPFDPRSDMLYWADSNFANTVVDDVRYGYVRAYQAWPLEDVAGWLTQDRGNGATLYRLREDIVLREAP